MSPWHGQASFGLSTAGVGGAAPASYSFGLGGHLAWKKFEACSDGRLSDCTIVRDRLRPIMT